MISHPTITVTGCSDDLVEIEGDMREEYYAISGDLVLDFGDGTLLRCLYGADGIWKLDTLAVGPDTAVAITRCSDPTGESSYTDIAEITGPLVLPAQPGDAL